MTLSHKDRVLEMSNTTGLGSFLLGGPESGYYTFFASFGTGVDVGYAAANPVTGENEVGIGQVVDNGDSTYSLTRVTIERSSNANAKVDFQGGRKVIVNVLLATEADSIANMANVILKNGSVDFTGDQSFGGHKATHMATPATGTDGANKIYVDTGDSATLAAAEAYADGLPHGTGNVSATNPTTVGDVPYWSTTGEHLSSSSTLAIHPSSSGKIEAKVGTFKAYSSATDGSTVTFDFDLADLWTVTLGGNRTLAYSHASVGQIVGIRLVQDATGGRTVTWWANILWHHSLAPVLDPTAAGSDLIYLECIGQDSYTIPIWEEVCRKSSAPRKSVFSDTDGATITFNLRKSPSHKVTLGGNRTLALVESHSGQAFDILLTQDGTGSRTVTWWSGITWAGGSAPTLSTTAGKSDWFGFRQSSTGAYIGCVIGQGI